MEIYITQWALNSYLDLVSQSVFTREEYITMIRPDVLLLKSYPSDPKFRNGKFWSVAHDRSGLMIPSGYKMKWHQVGNGHIQLRLTVGIVDNKCYLCEAYVKTDDKTDKRKLAKFKGYLELIRHGQYVTRGILI